MLGVLSNKKRFYLTLLLISVLTVAIRMYFVNVPPFQSDESVDVYASYAVARGIVPYREIVLSHPPIGYLFYSAVIKFFGNSIEAIRSFVSVLYSISVLITALLAKEILEEIVAENAARKGSYIAALLSAIYPGAFAFTMTAYLEVILISFILSGIFFVVLALKRGSIRLMVISGILFGLALFTKFVALFSVISLISLFLIPGIELNMCKKKALLSFILGFAVSSLTIISLIAGVWSAFDNFLTQAVLFQLYMRPPFSFEDRIETVKWYIDAFSILLILALPSALAFLSKFRNTKKALPLLPVWIYLLPLMLQFLVIGFWFHHLVYLTPFLCLMAGLSIYNREFTKSNKRIQTKKVILIALLTAVALYYTGVAITNPHRVSPYIYSLDPSLYTIVEKRVGSKVSEMTSWEDRIWTSEGAIAFFADRMIVTPASEKWPIAGLFDYWLGKNLEGKEGSGLVSISEFVESWERERPKVLVFIRNRGWISYPDELLLDGYGDIKGVKDYVGENYQLRDIVKIENNPYHYEIWVRKN